uniref:Serpin domain-containing protein n=1 Tax=Timema bartmani TaxID=61472 RepID=A0A7R9ERX9_9NEOP|nr:unnamed protein product [Timema bartmani]
MYTQSTLKGTIHRTFVVVNGTAYSFSGNLLILLGMISLLTTAQDPHVSVDSSNPDPILFVTRGLKKFALDLLSETSIQGGPNLNLVVSPYSVWALLVLIMEGAGGETANQIRAAINIKQNTKMQRQGYLMLEDKLQTNTSSIELHSVNALFTDLNRPIDPNYRNIAMNNYHCNVIPVNFGKPVASAESVNKWVSRATHQHILELVLPDDLKNPDLLLANAIFFRGQWKIPFNKNVTFLDKFYDEEGVELGKVQMMFHNGPFLHGFLNDIDAHFLELPYEGDKFCMLLVLPREKAPLLPVLKKLKSTPLDEVYMKLKKEYEEFMEDGVNVFLPRLSVTSDFVLNEVLQQLGIVDVFEEEHANLSGISSRRLYLSKLIHKAQIQITEEGTIASAATAASFGERTFPAQFIANRPFAYFIIQKELKIVLFAGKVAFPTSA